MNKNLIFLISIAALLFSCGVKKFIPTNETLYTGASLTLQSEENIDNLKAIEDELELVLRPRPNTKILGIKIGLYSYYKNQKENPGFINRFLFKNFGEEPVYLSDVDQARVSELINNRLENRGFFRSILDSEVLKDSTKARIVYKAAIKKPYKLQTYQVDSIKYPIGEDIKETLANSPIKKDGRFDLALFELERERIDKSLKAKGYYNFNADFLIFEADTNQYKNKRYDLFLRLKKEVPEKSLVPYKVNKINVFPNYSITTDSITKDTDTVSYSGINFIQNEEYFKPKRLESYILFRKGQLYNPTISKRTSNRLSSIGTYKFVNIEYDVLDTGKNGTGKGDLTANIYLSPLNKRALRAELQAVSKSNNFTGPNLLLTYANRNLFSGGETLNITASIGYETQLSGSENQGLSSAQIGLKSDLIFPRLLFPIKIMDRFKYAVPKTIVSAGFEYLNRSKLYSLNSVNTSFGYSWNANRFVNHELNPISINYVNLSNTTQEFKDILDENPFLKSSFDQQFIAGLTYSFIYNELNDSAIRNPFYFNANFDIAGNTVSLFGKEDENIDSKTFLGLEYAQYVKADIDFRYHFSLGNGQKLIGRLFGGWGLAYGNSTTLPFSKQYFSGGPFSVRAFRIRSLGPGTYTPIDGDSGSFFDRAGDIRLEANLEYRFPIIPYLKGAVFADAGNVWLREENDALSGGKFSSNFLNELGIGAGFGLRVDIQNFVIRFDLAAPLNDPSEEEQNFNFDVANPILNFAIGYPF
ncbi:BamA/TamA family outer membrane protein [uncultured Aquimarina sp.]|uniref:translocation and assembly module lipoprotein TamL n=1 Tax=uncultured Aquimarina sp. TaxID=575652 RepID=UPI00260F9AB0|nr:BamA/TamA family outer membrane protein [uncultured Aquimarina sp.]